MRYGEKAVFVFAPEHAIKDKAVPLAELPANAWLLYEIELLMPSPPIKIKWLEVFKTLAVVVFVVYYCFIYSPALVNNINAQEEDVSQPKSTGADDI